MSVPYVVAVVLNTNRCRDTLECLASLYRNTYPRLDVIVIDNASNDGSLEAIEQAYPQVRVIQLKQNLGYAGNNNIGIRLAVEQGADWVFVLNEDTVSASNCVETLVAVGMADSTIGMIGPMVYHFDEPAVIQSAGGMLTDDWSPYLIGLNESDCGQFADPHEVAWLSGCALLVKREVIEQLGTFDERLFIYWEETDWCLRAAEQNWKLMQVPAAKLWHKGVQRNYQPSPSVTYYFTRNKFLVLLKHKASARILATQFIQTLRTLTSWTVKPRWRAMRDHRDAMWQGLQDFTWGRWGMRPQ